MSAPRVSPATIAITLSFMVMARASGAIQLHWSSGPPDMTFSEARGCTLLVEAESGTTLPADWRLQWISASDSGAAAPLAFQAESGAGSDPAAACEKVEPADPASSAARILGLRFCNATPGAVTSARVVLDAAAGTKAKIQVVAFLPSVQDSMEGMIVRSSEVTLNGGCTDAYPPLIFRAASSHHLGQLDVRLTGVNLAGVSSVPISAPDSSWSYSLTVMSQTDEKLGAHAVLAAPLPDIVVGAVGGGGGLGAALVPADNFPPLDPQSCSGNFEGASDTTGLQPKDFAFLDAGDSWHVFYTRQYQTSNYTDRTNTRRIGHAVSTDQHLSSWTVVDRNAIVVRQGRIWDNLHVWAPTIFRRGITYYMAYTGVQLDTIAQGTPPVTSEIQRIGMATSTDLSIWSQDVTPVYFNKKVPWTFRDSTQHGSDSWQFRDPFVMEDSENPGEFLMYFVTIDSVLNKYVVGVARTSGGDPRAWKNVWPLRRTSATFMNADRDESPHAMFRHGNWWLLYTSNHTYGDQITYTLNATSPSDSSTWGHPDSLKAITCGQHSFPTMLNQWHGTEYVGIGPLEYLGAFADNLFGGGEIQFTQIRPPDGSCPTDSIRLDCPDVWTGVGQGPKVVAGAPITLRLAGSCPAHGAAPLRLALAGGTRVYVAIYDVFGRRVRIIADGWLPAGATTLSWDGRGDQGAVAGSGIYFARATGAGGRSVVRIPLLR